MKKLRKFHNTMTQLKGIRHFVFSKDSKAKQPTMIDFKEDLLPIDSASWDKVLQDTQTCLARVIGPIAKIVFQDAMHQWEQNTPADSNDFALLKKMVLNQIDDPDRKRKFEELITDYIENQR
ncbi:uncharacterized protein Dvar_53480 [Desulfosarcina variabilis str. Montpellier]|uniref:hypothetical protein n=1 Tax=Desulfosarcina variabilis TaxID=2300 RepID=UPI003AFB8081